MNLLIKIFKKSPLLRISSDENFDEYEIPYPKRFSLFTFSLGTTKIYIITIRNKKFQIYKILKFNDIIKWPTTGDFKEAITGYQEHLKNLDAEKTKIEAEHIRNNIDDYKTASSLQHTKMSVYFVVISIIITSYINQISESILRVFSPSTITFSTILSILTTLEIIKISTFVSAYIKTKPYSRPRFEQIKENPHIKTLTTVLYETKLYMSEELRYITSCTSNIHTYTSRLLLLATLAFLFEKHSPAKNSLNEILQIITISISKHGALQ